MNTDKDATLGQGRFEKGLFIKIHAGTAEHGESSYHLATTLAGEPVITSDQTKKTFILGWADILHLAQSAGIDSPSEQSVGKKTTTSMIPEEIQSIRDGFAYDMASGIIESECHISYVGARKCRDLDILEYEPGSVVREALAYLDAVGLIERPEPARPNLIIILPLD